MKRKIKIALYVRVVVLLIGFGLRYLLSNTFNIINNENNENEARTSSDDDFTSRRLMNVKDHNTRDVLRESQWEMQSSSDVVINDSNAEDLDDNTRSTIENTLHEGFARANMGLEKNGRIALHVLASCYCFLMLAVICDEYFIGSIEIMCQKLHVKEDVAGATFMAMATSSPELFINCVGTFITEGDIGVGTIVGSAVFNILAVPACCGLFTRTSIRLEWWAVSRDCIFYGLSVIGLVAVIYDNQIMWYEAACLVAAYGVYLTFMYKNDAMSEKAKVLARRLKRRIHRPHLYQEATEITPLFSHLRYANNAEVAKAETNPELSEPLVKLNDDNANGDVCATSPWKVPDGLNLAVFLFRWPITFILWCTIPDPTRFKTFYILTFINSVLWIGCISYFVVFISTNVDSVLGMVLFGAGTSLPEAVSSVIVTAQGYGSMGISNSIGSNIFDILLCLGLPWLIKTLIVPTISGKPYITLKSTGISYTAISLLTTLIALYSAFAFNKFKLDRRFGSFCLVFYLLFLIFALLVELNVFFSVQSTI